MVNQTPAQRPVARPLGARLLFPASHGSTMKDPRFLAFRRFPELFDLRLRPDFPFLRSRAIFAVARGMRSCPSIKSFSWAD
jgi:hypothetical protein